MDQYGGGLKEGSRREVEWKGKEKEKEKG